MLLIIEGGAVPIPLGEPARPVPAHRRPILEGYLRGFPPPQATGYRKTIVETLSGRGSEP